MTTSSFRVSTTASWVSLVVCALAFAYIALTAANTELISGKEDRDRRIQEVRASTDTHYLQERAAILIKVGALTSSLSMLLCRLALGALLVAMICSGITIVQAWRLTRQFDDSKRTG
jgi:4-hydroxybenzoate polyprenyltransferase